MEHWRITKQKFSNKKNYFKKETFPDRYFRAFAGFGCNFIQNMSSAKGLCLMSSAKGLCLRNFTKLVICESNVRRMTKSFPNFLLIRHIF